MIKKISPIFDKEREEIEKFALRMDIKLEFIPENIFMEEETGVMFCLNWRLNYDFFSEKNKNKFNQNFSLLIKKIISKEKILDKQKILSEQFMAILSSNNIKIKK